MTKSTLFSISRHRARIASSLASKRHFAENASIATSKSSIEKLQASVKEKLTSRPAEITKSVIDPTPSHLLNLTLQDFLPRSCHAPPISFFTEDQYNSDPGYDQIHPQPLPQGHHLAYFPPEVCNNQLLPDGTDTLHWPGPPFVRRLWAGGSVVFHPQARYQLYHMKGMSKCFEDIQDVQVKGVDGDEKVFVNIRRRMCGSEKRFMTPVPGKGRWQEHEESNEWPREMGDDNGIGMWSVVENRDLVFLRAKSREEAERDMEKKQRIVKPNLKSDFYVPITPTPELLFRWSALSFNAHRIHLDPQYCREIEGHRNMLVHGPLSLVMMFSVLGSQLKPGEMIMRLDYRNLAPLYVNEEMRICTKAREQKESLNTKPLANRDCANPWEQHLWTDQDTLRTLDVWIEGKEGGYAVRGTAVVGPKLLPLANTMQM